MMHRIIISACQKTDENVADDYVGHWYCRWRALKYICRIRTLVIVHGTNRPSSYEIVVRHRASHVKQLAAWNQ